MIGKTERAALMRSIADVIRERFEAFKAEWPLPVRGEKGDPGEHGPKGERGDPGESIVGPPGPQGPAGKDAEVNYPSIITEVLKCIPPPKDGSNGRDGQAGSVGPMGPQGLPGLPGQSITGPAGPPGKDAVIDYEKVVSEAVKKIPSPRDGIDGKDGAVGPRGERGESGPQGPPGESIRGEKGEPGEFVTGPQGPRGEQGLQGAPGESIIGPAGPQGKPGEPGPRGEKGEPGPPGAQGIQGKDGRDALQIDILPSVDLSRSYPRGTFARYDKGVIRAFRDTIPGDVLEKSGWEVVWASAVSQSVTVGDDYRTFTVTTRITGEGAVQTSFTLPVMIYRDIYRPENQYQRGDVVTYGGSTWHCQSDHPKAKPGTNGDWRLMVKEGQRGKDGKDGERGPQGLPGRLSANLTNDE